MPAFFDLREAVSNGFTHFESAVLDDRPIIPASIVCDLRSTMIYRLLQVLPQRYQV